MRKNYWAIKHDMSHTRIYRIWIGMRARCNNPNSVPYPYYGGKGIRVCEEWDNNQNGFANFYNWAVQNGYQSNLTIDRINPLDDYRPDNCRWADKHQQNVHLNKAPGRSGFYGISKHSGHNSWYGRVKVYGKVICTGSAATPLQAAIKRDLYIMEHGLDNRLNGVTDGYI